jgi:plastocyanin
VRRYPLIGRLARSGRVLLGAVLVAGCASAGAPPASAPAVVGVSIATAPGELLAFDPSEPSIAAAGSVRVRFRNASSLPHNLVFTGTLTASTRTIVAPGTSDELEVALPGPGRYPFVCTIHAEMSGALVVTDAPAQGAEGSRRAVGALH